MKRTYTRKLITGTACLLAVSAGAAPSIYFDINGAATGSGVASAGSYSWESSFWTTSSTGVAATTAFVEGDFTRFAAGTDAAAKNYTITASANHTIGGMFLQANGGGTVTINGPGVLSIDPTAGPVQGFLVNSSTQTLLINASLGGAGGVENENSGSLDLYGNNSYSGGTVFGTSAGLNINNNNSFGTGGITWGVAQQVLADNAASSQINLPTGNTMTTRAASQLIVVTPSTAPINFNGNWTLAAGNSTVSVGTASGPSSKLIISGSIGGAGNNLIVNSLTTSGTLSLKGVNSFSGSLTVSNGGIVSLDVNHTIDSISTLSLKTGKVIVNGTTQTIGGTLGLTGTSTIDFANLAGTLTLGSSPGNTWSGTLNIINFNPNIDTITVGTDSTGLTSGQLSEVVIDGGGLGATGIDSFGDLYLIPEPSSLALGALGGLGMLWMARRRKEA